MKTPIVIACLLFACTCLAQSSFEGTIKWSMKMEITDPAAKARMEEGQKKMNDPANQAKMKEMEAKMNDPQFKAMMDANPQMKAQMEKTMQMMQGGNLNSMMPSAFTVKIKNNNSIAQMEGGMIGGMEILNLTDKNQSYSLDRKNKTYTTLPQGSNEPQKTSPEIKVTKTNETAKILNYTCIKTIVEVTQNGKTMKNFYWTTTEIKDLDLKSLSKQRMGRGNQSMFYQDIDGVPLKMEMTMPEGTMTMEVTEIKKESLSASLFELPADFKEVKGYTGQH
ncbi:MAG: DUF4412 domain-containing protein [Chryseolinea sp.]